MHIRLVPFGTLAARLRRTVRQVAERSGKPVDLTLEGETVEVDKAVLEDMAEPLMHLLRNAVDHGIEPAERRRGRGKAEARARRWSGPPTKAIRWCCGCRTTAAAWTPRP